MKFKTLKLLISIFLLSIQINAANPPPPQPASIPPPVGLPLPIDSAIAVLLVIGILLGAFFKLKSNDISKL